MPRIGVYCTPPKPSGGDAELSYRSPALWDYTAPEQIGRQAYSKVIWYTLRMYGFYLHHWSILQTGQDEAKQPLPLDEPFAVV
jgi:hypothetical protein